MRVEAASNYLYTSPLRASERVREITAARAVEATQATQATQEVQASRKDVVRQADVTSMTRGGMIDWVNEQCVKGEITGDDIFSFVVLLLPCWTLDEISGQVDLARENIRYDFMQMARDRISMARASGEKGEKAATLLGNALSIMQRCQGQNANVDTFA